MNQAQAITYSQHILGKKVDSELKQKDWLEKKIKEYEDLGESLLDIGAKSSHTVMVPVAGGVAYFPNGKIKHSNEILVHIGDKYFMKRTSQECQPIIKRRIDQLRDQFSQLETTLTQDIMLKQLADKKGGSQWTDLKGNPTNNDDETHWDEEGCLDIREEYHSDGEEETKAAPVKNGSASATSPEPIQIFSYEPHQAKEAPIAKSPADIRKMMEAREKAAKEQTYSDEIRLVSQTEDHQITEKPASSILKKPSRPSPSKEEIQQHREQTIANESPFSLTVVEREPAIMQPIKFSEPPVEEKPAPQRAPDTKRKSKFRMKMEKGQL